MPGASAVSSGGDSIDVRLRRREGEAAQALRMGHHHWGRLRFRCPGSSQGHRDIHGSDVDDAFVPVTLVQVVVGQQDATISTGPKYTKPIKRISEQRGSAGIDNLDNGVSGQA